MDSFYYTVAVWGFALLTILTLGIFFYGLRYGLLRASLAEAQKKRIWIGSIALTAAWLSFTGVLSYLGFFSDFSSFPPRMVINVILPLIAIFSISFRAATKEILRHIPMHWLAGLQSFRIPVELFLWCMFMAGILPIQLTFEGYNYDILSGIGGLVLAILVGRGRSLSPTAWRIYQIVGLLLLATIVILSILSFPTPIRQFMNEPSNRMMVAFPFVWLPAVLVTMAYTLHIFSLVKLRQEA